MNQLVPNTRTTLRPIDHLPNASGRDSPVIVLVGDSISTPIPTATFDETASLWGILREEILKQNPDVMPSFYNRGIGGARWDHLSDNKFATLNATGLALPTWPDNPTVNPAADSWIDTIVTLAPDAVFFNFGMNDGDIFVEANFQDVMNDFAALLPNTDLVFITNMVPNLYSTTENIGGQTAQDGRLFVAERMRSYAFYNDIGLIDLGREQCRKVAGFDPTLTYMTRGVNAVAVSTPYTIGPCDLDFGLVADIPVANVWSSRIKVTISQTGANSASWLEIYRDGGKVAVEYVVLDNAAGRYRTIVSSVDSPTEGTMTLSVFLSGPTARIELNGELVDEAIIMRHGGRFSPVLSFLDGRSTAITATTFLGTFMPVTPQLTYAECFGSTGTANDVEGGNDQNHPSSKGWAYVFASVLGDTDLRLDRGHVAGGILRTGGVVPLITDNSTFEIEAPFDSGTFYLWCDHQSGGAAVVGAQVHFYAGASPSVLFSQLGSLTELAAAGTDLTGTTGADTKFTISIKDGAIELENRRGTAIGSARYMFLGPKG